MTDSKKGRIATAVTIMSAISVGIGLSRDAKQKYNDWTLYTASVNSESYVYPVLMEWLNAETKTKRIKFVSSYDGVKKYYDGSGTASFVLDGYTISVQIDKPEGKAPLGDYDSVMSDNLVFTSRTSGGIDAVHKFLEELTDQRKKQQRDISIYNLANYGWEGRSFPYRNLDSVFLDKGVKEELISDLDTFFANEKQYGRIGVPWHRGYLFYGAPGNGKSSLAASIAHRYRMNLYNLPLSGVKGDKELAEAVSRIQDNSILLLEDIDIFSKSMGREQSDSGPTLAGLLNALDGVSTPHGLMTFMTTNHIDNLDPALIRPGRIDKRIELTAPSQYQIEAMFEFAYGEPLGADAREFDSMAALSNVFKQFTTDPEAARLEIKGV